MRDIKTPKRNIFILMRTQKGGMHTKYVTVKPLMIKLDGWYIF